MYARALSRTVPLSLVVTGLLVSCAGWVPSSAGFELPEGDPEKGRADFVELGCNRCHEVEGVELPPPSVEPPVPVVLGSRSRRALTDGELVTAIIAPSHSIAEGYPRLEVRELESSRMQSFESMTVGQLVDVVAFLKSARRRGG